MIRPSLLVLSAFVVVLGIPDAARSDFHACLTGLKPQAAAKGISAVTFTTATQGIQPDMTALERMDQQPEFKMPIWDYLATLVDEERVADGRAALQTWSAALAAAEARYGVDRHVLAAVWGVEPISARTWESRPSCNPLPRSLASQ